MKTFHKTIIALNLVLAIVVALFAVSLFDQREIFKERILTLEGHAKTMSTTLEWGEFGVHDDQTRPERFGDWSVEDVAEAERMRDQIQQYDRMHIGLTQLEQVAADRFATMIANKKGWDATEGELGETDAELAATRVALEALQNQYQAVLAAHADTKDDLSEAKRGILALQGELINRDQQIAERDDQLAAHEVSIAQRDLELQACNKEWQHEVEQRILCCAGPDPVPSDDLEAKVVAMDEEMNFVVVDVGSDKRIKKHGTALIHRNGELVGKIAISRVGNDNSIGQILNDWTTENMTIQTGDEVLF